MRAMMLVGWGAGGCGDLDRDINRPPPIAGIGDDGDGEDADAGDDRGGASDDADGGDASGGGDAGDPNANDGGNDTSDPSAGDADAGAGDDRPGISGKLKKKDGEHIDVPVLCVVRVYEPGSIDPSTGEELGSFLEYPMTVWAFPQHFDLTALELAEFGETSGYVAAYCDQDGSGTVDASDRIGGQFPALPMELVPIPGANEVWLHLGALD